MIIDINRIKQTISSLDSGEFQVFCEQYLSLDGYKFVSSKGGISGTNITKPGTPDHICITDTGHYIFVEDTTQKGKGLKRKIIGDLEKCVITPKHRLPIDAIDKIVYCYNQELNDESIIEKCKEICHSKNIEFELLSLECFANSLFNNPIKYSRLAESRLGIVLSWFGIDSLDSFVENNERMELAPSLATSFWGRKPEMDDTISAIKKGESVILFGNPGAGKTRFAIEVCKSLESQGYSTICIKGNVRISIHNLLEAIECIQERHLIVFIDDVNEFSQLDSIQDIIAHTRRDVILLTTVRNYAKPDVEDRINSFIACRSVLIKAFSRDESKDYLCECFNIRNPNYTDAIWRLSKGNPRLIVLAAKLAIEKQNLNSITDASALYDAYYGSIINKLCCNNELMMTLGLVAYENRIYLRRLDYLKTIFVDIGISMDAFISECKFLASTELFEINKDVVYFTDQSFKCFIQKKVFVDKKTIPLGLMVKRLFFVHPSITKNTIRSLLSVFGNKEITEFIISEIRPLIDDNDIQENEAFLSFLSFFSPFFPMRAISHILKMMNSISSWTPEECTMVVNVLESFADTNLVDDAIELLFRILKQRAECSDKVVQVFKSSFSFKPYSKGFDYCTQEAVLKKIDSTLPNATPEELSAIKSILPQYLKTHFQYTESGETEREIRVCQYDLRFDEKLTALRSHAWKILFSLPGFASEVEGILLNYARESYSFGFDTRIGVTDWTKIEEYINSHFDNQKLRHCLIVEHLCEKIPSISNSDIVAPFMFSKCYLLYKSFEGMMESKEFYDYEHYVLPESFVADIRDYTLNDFLFLFDTIREIKSIKAFRQPIHLIPSIFNYVEEKNEIDLLKLAKYCVSIDIIEEPFLISVLLSLLARHYPDDILLIFISVIDEQYRNNWMWAYYASKTESQINDEVMKGFYEFLGTPDQKLSIIGFRSITGLKQYDTFDPSFIFNCLSIIEKNFKQAPFLYSSYLKDFFMEDPSQIIECINGDFSLLFNCYCNLISTNNGIEDYDGQFLAYVSCLNNSFLEQYLVFASQHEDCIRNPYERLQSLWNSSSYIEFADCIYCFAKKNGELYKFHSLFDQFFANHHIEPNQKEEVNNRIKAWVFHIIDSSKDDKNEMSSFAELIEFIPLSIRSDCIVFFLDRCDDVAIFKKIELIPFYESWSGSKIPMLNERIEYLETLKQRINEPQYLDHRMIIDNYIEFYRKDINETEIRELMEDWD